MAYWALRRWGGNILESEVIGPSKIRRKLITAPVSKMVVRYRLPRPLPPSIELPDGKGGWTLVVNAINKAMSGTAIVKGN